ncbi:MAG TPA: SH3 domain-containing protein [Aggregatilineaceae bacterium]|nr:SH3 domain-containing protein [Aggregatilineaceae bacterium]
MLKRFTIVVVLAFVFFASQPVLFAQTPLNAPGGLCVRIDRQQLYASPTIKLPEAQLIILDKSGSMSDPSTTGGTRLELAQDVLRQYITDMPNDSLLGLRTYGIDGSCVETELVYPIALIDRPALISVIDSFYADGKTPIADTLSYIPSDMQGISGVKEVLLVTDGQETCGGDPVSVASSLDDADPDLAIHVVGFAIDDAQAQQNLREIPRVARGTYIPAESQDDLLQALSVVIRVPFQAYDLSGAPVGEGLSNRTTLALEPGNYLVDVPDLGINDVALTLVAGRGTSLYIDADGHQAIIENDGLCIAEFCPDVPLPRLTIGEGGRVTLGDPRPVRVRSAPGLDGQVLTELDLGEEFDVLDGPICLDGYLWWHVRNSRTEGWSAEGVTGNYYLEPWP